MRLGKATVLLALGLSACFGEEPQQPATGRGPVARSALGTAWTLEPAAVPAGGSAPGFRPGNKPEASLAVPPTPRRAEPQVDHEAEAARAEVSREDLPPPADTPAATMPPAATPLPPAETWFLPPAGTAPPGPAQQRLAALPLPLPPPRVPEARPEPLTEPVVGDTTLAIEAVRCREPWEAFVLVLRGPTVGEEGGGFAIRLDKRFSVGFDNRRSGVSDKERWCIPRRRVCWEPAVFEDWGGSDHAGTTRSFPREAVARDGPGALPRLVERAVAGSCHLER